MTPGTIEIECSDERRRQDAAPGTDRKRGHGLIGMRERATLLGGAVAAGPQARRYRTRLLREAEAAAVIRVLIADDQQLVRSGFRMMLEAEGDIEVVAEAADGQEAVDLGTSCARRRAARPAHAAHGRHPGDRADREGHARQTRVLVVTTFDADEYVYAALRAGASGFLLKDAPPRGAGGRACA